MRLEVSPVLTIGVDKGAEAGVFLLAPAVLGVVGEAAEAAVAHLGVAGGH